MKVLVLFFSLSLPLSYAQDTLVITDLDDTLRQANATDYVDAAKRLLKGVKPFPFSSYLLKEIQKDRKENNEVIDFVYLSASYRLIYNANSWLRKFRYPQGKVIQRGSLKSSKEFKKKMIRNILQANRFQYEKIIFIGDNGQADPIVYVESQRELGLDNASLFIRDVTAQSIPLIQDLKTKRYPEIQYFFTSLDLVSYSDFDFLAPIVKERIQNYADKVFMIADFVEENLVERIEEEICESKRKRAKKKCKREAASQARDAFLSYLSSYLGNSIF